MSLTQIKFKLNHTLTKYWFMDAERLYIDLFQFVNYLCHARFYSTSRYVMFLRQGLTILHLCMVKDTTTYLFFFYFSLDIWYDWFSTKYISILHYVRNSLVINLFPSPPIYRMIWQWAILITFNVQKILCRLIRRLV